MSKLSSQIQKAFSRWGRSGGRLRAQRLSPTQRSQIASRAAQARWKVKAGQTPEVHDSVRLQRADWKNPVYLEEILSDGRLSDWRILYRQISDFPFGPTAEALSRVLSATEIYGATPLWRGLLAAARGGTI